MRQQESHHFFKRYSRKTRAVLLACLFVMVVCLYSVNRNDQSSSITISNSTFSLKKDIRNYLLLGIDTEGSLLEEREPGLAGQSDAIYLLSCEMKSHHARLIAIPRDTMTEIEVFLPSGKENGTSVDHLTLQYAFGDGKEKSCELMRKAVSHLLYGIPIHGYLAINLGAIPSLTDAIGGVEVIVPDDSASIEDPAFVRGARVTLDGKNVKKFLRFRDIETSSSALTRMERHKTFFKACANKIKTNFGRNPVGLFQLYRACKKEFVTDLSFLECGRLVNLELEDDVAAIPGVSVNGGEYDEFYVDEDALQNMLIRMFCER